MATAPSSLQFSSAPPSCSSLSCAGCSWPWSAAPGAWRGHLRLFSRSRHGLAKTPAVLLLKPCQPLSHLHPPSPLVGRRTWTQATSRSYPVADFFFLKSVPCRAPHCCPSARAPAPSVHPWPRAMLLHGCARTVVLQLVPMALAAPSAPARPPSSPACPLCSLGVTSDSRASAPLLVVKLYLLQQLAVGHCHDTIVPWPCSASPAPASLRSPLYLLQRPHSAKQSWPLSTPLQLASMPKIELALGTLDVILPLALLSVNLPTVRHRRRSLPHRATSRIVDPSGLQSQHACLRRRL